MERFRSPFLELSRDEQRLALEAIIFASDEPLAAKMLYKLLVDFDAYLEEEIDDDNSVEQAGESGSSDPNDSLNPAVDVEREPEAGAQTDEAETEGEAEAAAVSESPVDDSRGADEEEPAGDLARPEDSASPKEKAVPANNGLSSKLGTAAEKLKKISRARQNEVLTLFAELIGEINEDLEESGRPFRIVRIAGGYQFATLPNQGEIVARLDKSKSKRRLSRAALESLAIIAYRQPISKVEIENIRGVNCGEVVKKLLEKSLITIVGRADAVGRPLLYGTTEDFLRAFGLHDIADLPKPRELKEILQDSEEELGPFKTVMVSDQEDVVEIEDKIKMLVGKDTEGQSSHLELIQSKAPAGETQDDQATETEKETGAATAKTSEEEGRAAATPTEDIDAPAADESNESDQSALASPQDVAAAKPDQTVPEPQDDATSSDPLTRDEAEPQPEPGPLEDPDGEASLQSGPEQVLPPPADTSEAEKSADESAAKQTEASKAHSEDLADQEESGEPEGEAPRVQTMSPRDLPQADD